MTDFLLELRSEEIPARMQDKARDDLARLFTAEIAKAGLTATETITYAGPRRLALIARDLPDETAAVSEEVKGPKTSAPPQALDGFLRKTGLIRDQLVERDGVFFAVTDKPGRATADVLAEAIPAIIRQFPWPKSMRWGAASTSTESLRWVRPLHGMIALFGEQIVDIEVASIRSGAQTLGHRFHHPGPITIGSAADYVEKLRACHVLVDQDERRALIRTRAADLASDAGLELVEDEGLVAENAGLTEWPVPLLGRFDEAFLEVPPEVIQLTARVNQKYFVCRSADGALANAFICTANIEATDGGARIVEGNRKVLAARLADARFFYDTDLKVPLEQQAEKLRNIVFHEKLGTVADKVDRVAKLARWLVEEGIILPGTGRGTVGAADGGGGAATSAPHSSPARGGGPAKLVEGDQPQASRPVDAPLHHPADGSPPRTGEELADLAERAARLAKADLVTGMVGEFPELQGLMGGYYALAQGEDPAVAAAIRNHYKPVGQGDDVPTDPVTVAVSLAEKLDTLTSFFAANEFPTGSRDPFALRRAALGVLQIMFGNNLRIELTKLFHDHLSQSKTLLWAVGAWAASVDFINNGKADIFQPAIEKDIVRHLTEFLADRLKVQQREAGVRHDLIDAVFALGGEDDLVRLLARVRALQAFVGTDDGTNLLAGYKRAANILKKEGWAAPSTRHPGLEPGSRSSEEGEAGPRLEGRGDDEVRETISLSYTPEPTEAALIAALDVAEPAAAAAVTAEDFEGAMAALASLRAPIDSFFDSVTVNDPDADKRAARLALLARVRAAVHQVADFSKIEG